MPEPNQRHHLLITGTGRAGTTFLVKLLTLLDIDTGFPKDFISASRDIRAGLEHQGLGGDLPYVVKNPKLMWQLPELLRENPVIIDHILVPIREIHAASESRRQNVLLDEKNKRTSSLQDIVGGLEGVDDPALQEEFFLKKFYHFFEFVSAYQIPVTMLHYPRLIYDSDYLYQKLRFLLDETSQERFQQVFNEVCDPSLVHKYSKEDMYCLDYDDAENVRQLQERTNLVTQINLLRKENEQMQQDKDVLSQENYALRQENSMILASQSWRYTRLFRVLMALFRMDKRYLYDAAQQIRNRVWVFRQGTKAKYPQISGYFVEPYFKTSKKLLKPILRFLMYRVLCRPEVSIHHELIGSPYESDYQENQDFSVFSTDIKAIAFYLPQFHQIPENDRWWSEGFTEWTNTKQAKPLFAGHYQPREPHDDIGYYDLSEVATLEKQAALARQHGIYGFCFYYYYFHGKRLLEKPIEMLLDHPEIDIHFCLCWANESWTKKWDGAEHEILIAQEYSPQDDVHFMRDIARYMKDPRYVKVNGRPVIMVYRPLLLPDPRATFDRWRHYCRQNGVGEITIWVVRGCFNQETGLGLEDVTEAEVEFPPHLTVPFQWISPSHIKSNKLKVPLVNYKALVKSVISHEAVVDKLSYPVYRTAMLGWDNTARRKEMGYVFYGFSTRFYYKWIRHIMEDTRRKFPSEERFLFINAWNEWAEGTYLEPDKRYGYTNINTTSKALFDLPYRLKRISKTGKKKKVDILDMAELTIMAGATANPCSVAVHAHIFYTDLTDELIFYMNNIPVDFDCYITTNTEDKKQEILVKTRGRLKARHTEIRITPNVGRDVGPFLVGCRDIMSRYDYVCHIHTKKSRHGEFGDLWREYLLEHLLGSRRLVQGILDHFAKHSEIGLIYPPVFASVEELAVWGGNVENVQLLLRRVGAEMELPDIPKFPVGTMVWMRAKAFENLFEAGFTYDDFEEETGQLDGTLAHAFERSLAYIVDHNGYTSRSFTRE